MLELIHPTKGKLRVFSAICVNLFTGWIVTLFVIKDLSTLTATIIAAILSLYLAVATEEWSETL